MKKIIAIFFSVIGAYTCAYAQQYPFWTQYKSNQFMLNPAVAGTRKTLDVRLNYRNQWTGFEGAPKTMGLSMHGRFYKGKMGAGAYVYRDQLGPAMYTTLAAAYSFHIKFSDTELSFGANANYNILSIDASRTTFHNSQDQAILNTIAYSKTKIPNAAMGLLYFNDRFHIGFAMNNMLGTSYEFPKVSDGTKKAHIKTVPHYNMTIGYNWSNTPDLVFENMIFANYVNGTPILLDYSLRMHIRQGLFVGAGIRLKNSISAQLGYTLDETFQVSYSYDYSTNALRAYNSGTHEIKLVYVYDKDKHLRHGQNDSFQHKHFKWLL
ncbi:MAG: type IX secretion system membrane protein PorP/SprF [Bacteroidia bacterium]